MTVGTIYILGAGFSRTCGIATDIEMLDALNPYLDNSIDKLGGQVTAIDSFKAQNFPNQTRVGFELFMSTISALKFMPEFIGIQPNIFHDGEREIRSALKRYLKEKERGINWIDAQNRPVLDFVKKVDWGKDYVLTFNYDLVVENAAKHLNLIVADRVIHLHGARNERVLAWPTYKKLAYKTTRSSLATRWNQAFALLRQTPAIDRLIFIGYSMPSTDLEARGLFNYTDWYNRSSLSSRYGVTIVNPAPSEIQSNYSFFRAKTTFHPMTLGVWVNSGMPS